MKGRMVRNSVRFLGVVTVLALTACDDTESGPDGPRYEHVRIPPPPLDSLRAAPETITVGGVRFAAGAELWMNLMPGPEVEDEPAGPPMTPVQGTIDIHPADPAGATALPIGLAVEGAWLRAGDSIWALGIARPDTARAARGNPALQVWGGPPWLGRDSRVDVVVRVRLPDGAPVLLRVRGYHVEVAE
jgi:hypothetical protein